MTCRVSSIMLNVLDILNPSYLLQQLLMLLMAKSVLLIIRLKEYTNAASLAVFKMWALVVVLLSITYIRPLDADAEKLKVAAANKVRIINFFIKILHF